MRRSLKRRKESDQEMVLHLHSDRNINKFVTRGGAEIKEKALAFISRINNEIARQIIFYWKITEVGKNEMIGSVCL